MLMPTVMTRKVPLFVNVIMGILEMDLPVLVRKYFFECLKFSALSLTTYSSLFFNIN